MGPRCVLGDNSAAHSYLQLLTSGYLHKPLAPLLPAPLIPETMGPHAGSGFSCRSVGWALGVKPEAERGTSGTGEDLKGWAPPRFGSLWEERGASGQAPTGASEQMAEEIIKIQLCSHRRLGLTEEEAAGGRVGVGCGVGERLFSYNQNVKNSLSAKRLPASRLGAPFTRPTRTLGQQQAV